jgi:hypothetical protein
MMILYVSDTSLKRLVSLERPVKAGVNISADGLSITDGSKKVKFHVRDKCMGCLPNHLDMAPKGFEKLFGVSGGTFGMESQEIVRKQPFSWKFVDA